MRESGSQMPALVYMIFSDSKIIATDASLTECLCRYFHYQLRRTHQRSRDGKNRKKPIETAWTEISASEQFLFVNRRFPQFKSREKITENATLSERGAERS